MLTEYQKSYIQENYETQTNVQLSTYLEISKDRIINFLTYNKLKRSAKLSQEPIMPHADDIPIIEANKHRLSKNQMVLACSNSTKRGVCNYYAKMGYEFHRVKKIKQRHVLDLIQAHIEKPVKEVIRIAKEHDPTLLDSQIYNVIRKGRKGLFVSQEPKKDYNFDDGRGFFDVKKFGQLYSNH